MNGLQKFTVWPCRNNSYRMDRSYIQGVLQPVCRAFVQPMIWRGETRKRAHLKEDAQYFVTLRLVLYPSFFCTCIIYLLSTVLSISSRVDISTHRQYSHVTSRPDTDSVLSTASFKSPVSLNRGVTGEDMDDQDLIRNRGTEHSLPHHWFRPIP